MLFRTVLLVPTVFLLNWTCQANAADRNGTQIWAGFRGDGTGVTTAANLPLEWSPKKNIAWTIPLPGEGQSSPVVWKDRAFLTSVEGPEKDNYHVMAVSLVDGKLLWKKTFPATQKVKSSSFVSKAAGTPLVDEHAVYAFLEGGSVVALSHGGETLWERFLVKDYGEFKNNHGLASSLAGTPSAVLVLIDHQGPSYLLALDKKTGKNLWKTDRTSRGSWTSPIVVRQGKRDLVVISSGGAVDVYDAARGELLASQDGFEGNNIPSASSDGEVIVVGAAEGRGAKVPGASAKSNCCLTIAVHDGKAALKTRWQSKKVLSSMPSPLIYRGHAYFVNKAGVVTCMELASGKEVFAERLADGAWASAVASGDHIWFVGKNGVATVIKTGPAFEKVAVNETWASDSKTPPAKEAPKEGTRGGGADYGDTTDIVYGVAAVEGTFLVRTANKLYCIRASK